MEASFATARTSSSSISCDSGVRSAPPMDARASVSRRLAVTRASGAITDSIEVGEAPTHVITIPTPGAQFGVLTIPLSAENGLAKVEDRPDGLQKVDEEPSGEGNNHPHGHWLTCGDGKRTIVSRSGGIRPIWTADASRLCFQNDGEVVCAAIERGAQAPVERRSVLRRSATAS